MHNNILEFISFEHNNELVSIANLKDELGFLQKLDEIYQETKDAFPVDGDNDVHVMVGVMMVMAHSEFYAGMSQFLKSHLSKAFISLRISIDASFIAYYFTKNPKDTREYLDEKSKSQKNIFRRIKDHIAKNPKKFSLAQNLIKIHELASNFAAHPSAQSLVYKFQHIIDKEQRKEEVKLNYFDALSLTEFLSYYFGLLKGFLMVFQLFYNCFYKNEFKVVHSEIGKRISMYEGKLNLKGKQYSLSKKK